MIEKVYYLVISDRSGAPGLIFPTETSYNSFKTGQWFIVVNGGRINDIYTFDVVQNGELFEYYLKRIRNNIFQVTTKEGLKFYFRIEQRRYWPNRYVGNSTFIKPDDMLLLVRPIDPEALSNAAKTSKTFFVASVDNQIQRKD